MVNVDLSNLWIEDMKWGCDFPNFRYFWDHGFWMIKFQEILSSGDLRPVNKSGRGSMRGGEVSWADVDVGGSSAPQCGLVPNLSSYSYNIQCSKSYKPHVFCKLMTATIHWTHKNPSAPLDPTEPKPKNLKKQACKARRCDSSLQIWNYKWLTHWPTDWQG